MGGKLVVRPGLWRYGGGKDGLSTYQRKGDSDMGKKTEGAVKKILIATDGSDHARKAVSFGGDFASRYESSVHLIHVVQEDRIPDQMEKYMEAEHIEKPPVKAYLQTIGKKIIEGAKAELAKNGVTSVEAVLLTGDAPQKIIDYAKKQKIDVIVMGNRGLGRLRELFIGSVTQKVFHAAPCTCLIVK
jgi:nucleotide-binding universal stress UspA family protein